MASASASSPMTTATDAPTLTVGTTADSPSVVSISDGSGSRSRSRSVSLSPPPIDEGEGEGEEEVDELESDDEPVVVAVPKSKGRVSAIKAAAAKSSPKSVAKASPKSTPKFKTAGAAKSTPKGTPKTPTTAQKRKSLAAEETPKKKARKSAAGAAEDEEEKPERERGTYCHQCRTKCEPEGVLRCTRMRKYTKHGAPRACNLAWCERDLEKRYDISPADVRSRGQNVSAAELANHDPEKEYVFTCPCCLDECQNATCRQKKGLPRLGDVVKLAGEQGITPLELVRRINAEGPQPTGKSREDAESDLTDLDAPKKAAAKKKAPATKTKKEIKIAPKDAKAKAKATTKAAAAKGKAKEAAKKDTKKDAKKGTKEPKKEVKKKEPEEPPVDPPVFNLVNSKLSYDEIEHRLYLREFVNRFRSLLGIPDRSISHLDDFDHPLSEATVRQVAGGLMDLIIQDEGRSTGVSEDDIEMVSDKREEMRHYADLARFAQVYKEIAGPLNLKMLEVESVKDRNDRAMRALLDLGANDPAPTWALETGPSRRAAASRLPSASEVVRMLIAMADHVIHLDAVRSTMDPAVGNTYNDFLRKISQYNKEENARWETVKKGIMAERVRCKSAEQTKANKAKYEAENAEHNMRLRAGQVSLNTVAARKQTKFAPLGTDPDGRIYFALTPRLIDEERYRPTGWTRGIMVWGPGIEEHAAQDELPTRIPRWSHISTAVDARQLAKWLGWRVRKAIRVAEAEEAQREKEAKAAAKKTPKKGSAAAANGNGTPTANGKPPSRSTFDGVVIPRTGLKNAVDDDDSDAESALSDAPETTEDLLALLDPPGYVPGADKAREGLSLVSAVENVAALLEVLEWKGYA